MLSWDLESFEEIVTRKFPSKYEYFEHKSTTTILKKIQRKQQEFTESTKHE